MKYLKYFESINNLKPNDFDTECLEEVKSILKELRHLVIKLKYQMFL